MTAVCCATEFSIKPSDDFITDFIMLHLNNWKNKKKMLDTQCNNCIYMHTFNIKI